MFKIVDIYGCVHDAYGTFIDNSGYIQFILCDNNGEFYKTDKMDGFYKLYLE